MIELIFLKVLMLIRKVHLNSLLFVAIGVFQMKSSSFQKLFVMGVMIY